MNARRNGKPIQEGVGAIAETPESEGALEGRQVVVVVEGGYAPP